MTGIAKHFLVIASEARQSLFLVIASEARQSLFLVIASEARQSKQSYKGKKNE
jgi:hypothetical protein